MGHTIVLAHGVLGFGDPEDCNVVNYFNGVAAELHKDGHRVKVPTVDPFGSIKTRGDQLASEVRAAAKEFGEPVHIIAHSMGGLDARHAITNVIAKDSTAKKDKRGDPVSTLITIGTPHFGSPVADALHNAADSLLPGVFTWLKESLGERFAALKELATAFVKDFDANTRDVEGVRYIQVAGNAANGIEHPLFRFLAHLGKFNEINDGVVGRSSALRLQPGQPEDPEKHLKDWPVDHAGEVGWGVQSAQPLDFLRLLTLPEFLSFDLLPIEALAEPLSLAPLTVKAAVEQHLARYRDLAERLR